MSVSNNQNADENTFNGAYLSLSKGGSVIAKINLNAPSAESGEAVYDLQKAINDILSSITVNQDSISTIQDELNSIEGGYKMNDLQQIADGATLPIDNNKAQFRMIEGDVGEVTLSPTPFGTNEGAFSNGMRIRVLGWSDTKLVKVLHNDQDYGCILNGNKILGKGSSFEVVWVAEVKRFIEL